MITNKMLINHSFQLLNVDFVTLNKAWNFKNVISPYYRIYYIDGGEGWITGPNGSMNLRPGYLYMIPSFTLCNLSCINFLSQYFIQFFDESPDRLSLFSNCRETLEVEAKITDIANFKRLVDINPGRGINRSDDPVVYEKEIYYKEYIELNQLQSIATQYETQGIILQLVSRFLNLDIFRKNKLTIKPSTVIEAIEYIELNLQKELKVSMLANKANLSANYFSRLFYLYTGQRLINYILQRRIERAQYLIISSKMQLQEISELTGFDNVHYFSRVFKSKTGLTPGCYRIQDKHHNSFI